MSPSSKPDCVTERTDAHGYWWRYEHSHDEPHDTLLTAIVIAGDVAATEARKSGKTYLVARAASGVDAIYVFACDHPDARNRATYPQLLHHTKGHDPRAGGTAVKLVERTRLPKSRFVKKLT